MTTAAPGLSMVWLTWVGPIIAVLLIVIFVIGIAVRRHRMSARDIDGSRYRPRHR
ncbi:hypothetical protein [Asanoa sp. NPDC050611]|uniref:hypothetical protein n=1 Tax=Asanoa sp. NPDC050611 TaxID=3157098 RepID=UPI0033E888C1